MEKYKVNVNETVFELGIDALGTLDIIKQSTESYHVLKDDTAYKIMLLERDTANRTQTVQVNGNVYKVSIADSYDATVEKMGLLVNNAQKAKDILAPMPGLIVKILVTEGEEIEEGTPLIVLSAMKMENQILSQGAGTIKSIAVSTGEAVNKGQLIIEIE